MKDKNSLHTSPQLDRHEQLALALSPKQIHSLFNKAVTSGFSTDVIVEVYSRGYDAASVNQVQAGFDRVNSFINGGEASSLDSDLTERIKHIAKQAAKDVLSTAFPHVAKAVSRYKKKSKWRKAMMKEAVVNEPQSTDPDEASSRFVGTDSLTKILKADTPGQQRVDTIKRVVRDTINNKKDPAE